jgi:hypothetical protein
MKTIPQLRDEMLVKADVLHKIGLHDFAGIIEDWVASMYRRAPVRRRVAPTLRERPDAELIGAYADAHPDADYMTIANHFGCSIGRVSEALAGFREAA